MDSGTRVNVIAMTAIAVAIAIPCIVMGASSATSFYTTTTTRPAASTLYKGISRIRPQVTRNVVQPEAVQISETFSDIPQKASTNIMPPVAVTTLGAAVLAAAAALIHKAVGQQQTAPANVDAGSFDTESIAMAAITSQGTGRRHDFALIVNNKGGGHGEIGFHLALALRAKGLEVQLINDNGGKDITSKPPFSKYGELTAAGVEVSFTDLSQPGALQAATCPPGHLCRAYDYVFDNQNVCQKDAADVAAQCGAFYTYVSSGGMYIPGDKFPMCESTPSKKADSSAQKKHEEYVMNPEVRSKLRGCAFFRPQYIVGPYTNKRDYLDWFFDRLTRNLPIPLPAPGTQTTTVTDARDVANMLASVVGKQGDIYEAEKANPAVGPVFNCASDRPVTLRQVAVACGAACGKSEAQVDALIKLFPPALMKEAPSGGKFPFRATNFDVGVAKAKVVLDWEAEYNDFEEVAIGYYEGYKALGLDKSNPKMDTSFDQYILSRI